MTPEQEALLNQTANKLDTVIKQLNELMFVYYKTNFPDFVLFDKNVEVSGTFKVYGVTTFADVAISNLSLTGNLTIADGKNIILDTTTGTKIGTSTTQKIGFFGVTPVIQQASISAPSTPSAAYSQAEAQSAVDAINALRTRLQTFGFIA